ncbi:pyrroline-5-carboxylate reductase [Paenisporosarcina cavernae]|uniref:Pyrroline-5-carboxylate reductase n=1 Tax=Paenisporosarcina cavernae TaxID=2320858 RepID=A0A385YX69_9BACL|nr:pyrroline-5-carboxylate reductase [Paenisporosarcina cavernae]AYC30278.1 pyrroline-5-carboxylate reductase [Paenisporosarcina cavernae]
MDTMIGFVGCGKMAQAIIHGMITYGGYSPKQIVATARTHATRESIVNKFGINVQTNNKEVASSTDILFLAIKPHDFLEVVKEISPAIRKDTLIVTAGFGVTLNEVGDLFPEGTKIVRIMPNTPAYVGEGMTAYCPNACVSEEEIEKLDQLFTSFGKAERVPERLMDTITAVSGSSPAYVYMFIEALADGAVRHGVPRDLAYQLVGQSVLGAAKMVLETGQHPGKLKDDVTTPNGSTIRAIESLEADGFRGAIIQAVGACFKK